jgi:hypothetical protein
MAWLREREWCDGARLINSWRGTDAAIVAVEFILAQADPILGVQVERGFLYWLKQLSALSEQQLQHYVRLAQRRFNSQTALDQLRDLAFDVPALPGIDTQAWQRWVSRFRPEGVNRLWITDQVKGAPVRSRGFDLLLAPFIQPSVAPGPEPTLCFHTGHSSIRMQPSPWIPLVSPTVQPAESVTLRHIAAGEKAVLMLYPAPASGFTELHGHILQAALRATAANLAHGGAELRIERQQGIWLLQLCADDAMIPSALETISARLRSLSEAAIRQGHRARQHELQREQGQIPVRRLLSQLPGWLWAATGDNTAHRLEDIRWQGTLYGGTTGLHQTLSRTLSRFPGTFTAPERPGAATPSVAASVLPATASLSAAAQVISSSEADRKAAAQVISSTETDGDAVPTPVLNGQPAAARYTLTQTEGDNAFILFCPLPDADIDTHLAWRLLALIYQPLFFQQLRVEQNIGYVASCSFHDTAWRSGILFALQSPHLNGEDLHQRTLSFLQQMEQRLEEMPEHLLAELRSTLWQMLTRRDANRFTRARQACFAVDGSLTTLKAQARLEQMDLKALRRWHRIFTDSARHCGGNTRLPQWEPGNRFG